MVNPAVHFRTYRGTSPAALRDSSTAIGGNEGLGLTWATLNLSTARLQNAVDV